jgi:hypothetical protein
MSSSMIHGVSRDAEAVAQVIAERVRDVARTPVTMPGERVVSTS